MKRLTAHQRHLIELAEIELLLSARFCRTPRNWTIKSAIEESGCGHYERAGATFSGSIMQTISTTEAKVARQQHRQRKRQRQAQRKEKEL